VKNNIAGKEIIQTLWRNKIADVQSAAFAKYN